MTLARYAALLATPAAAQDYAILSANLFNDSVPGGALRGQFGD